MALCCLSTAGLHSQRGTLPRIEGRCSGPGSAIPGLWNGPS
jgi:hypothetical protein